jgi:hypothetical protein
MSAAVLVNNDDAHDRRRFTTAFAPGNRSSTVTSAANKRLSNMNAPKDSDRKDWRMCTCVLRLVVSVKVMYDAEAVTNFYFFYFLQLLLCRLLATVTACMARTTPMAVAPCSWLI